MLLLSLFVKVSTVQESSYSRSVHLSRIKNILYKQMLLITNLQACQPRRADGRDGTKSSEQEKKRGAGYRVEI